MGLLDDAIREHLELKRRHGADPGEVARQESEVLGRGRTPAQAAPEPAGDVAPPPPPDEDIGVPTAEHDVLSDVPPPSGARPAADVDPDAPAGALSANRFAAESDVEWSDPAPLRGEAEAEDDEEDVLEETPEFLQETPEHDRLWFEQKPPRDFDF